MLEDFTGSNFFFQLILFFAKYLFFKKNNSAVVWKNDTVIIFGGTNSPSFSLESAYYNDIYGCKYESECDLQLSVGIPPSPRAAHTYLF